MPPKRRGPTSKPQPSRRNNNNNHISKLARENDLSAEEESEIREAYELFAQAFPNDNNDTMMLDDEYSDQGVLSISDVRRALIALNLPPSSPTELREILSTLDPTKTGFTTYGPFVRVCALKLQQTATTADDDKEEVEAAFRLFTQGGQGPITVKHLRRVARELKEENVTDEQLRDMILEANGGQGVARGVRLEEFEGVMRRAGVLT